MGRDPVPGSLDWKFLASSGRTGKVWWCWQVWTNSGDFLASSSRQFDSFTECEQDANAHGYAVADRAAA